MTGGNKAKPTLKAIYAYLSTVPCEQAIREHFLDRWLPEDRSLLKKSSQLPTLVWATRTLLIRRYLFEQDPAIDPEMDAKLLGKKGLVAFMVFSNFIHEAGLDNLPPLIPPPTPQEIEAQIASSRALEEEFHGPQPEPKEQAEETREALEAIYNERMTADLLERFLPEVLMPMVAASQVAGQEGGSERPSSAASKVKGKLLRGNFPQHDPNPTILIPR